MIPGTVLMASAPAAPAGGGGGGGGGGGTPTISLTNQSVSAASNGGTATAQYTVKADGTVTKGIAGTFLENWISDPTQAGNYDVMASLSSGATPHGTLGSWLALSADQTWNITNSAADGSTVSSVLTVQIRERSTTTVKATATITLAATSNSGGGGV